ncbi:MAG TPA: type II secretion system F family protein [Roseiarcus sp.]|nr:type II secretion system F family protein [Roseiarcus sp.]
MPQFRYRAVTTGGDFVAGEVEAASREEVARRAEYLGHLLIEAELLSTSGRLARKAGGAGRRKLKKSDVTMFLRQLALLIRAGLTLEAALQTLAEDSNRALTWLANALRSAITSGDGFAEALERHPNIIEPAYIAMVKAGEASGKLEPVLRAVVEDRTHQELLSERVSSALRYPSFLIFCATLILFFFLLFVVPQFESVFSELGSRLNSGAALVLAASIWLRSNLQAFLGGCLALTLGLWILLRRRDVRAGIVQAISAIPGIAGTMRDRRTTRIISALGLMLENGVSLPTTLRILRDIVSEPRLVAVVDRVHDQVRSGRRFADALAETDLLPPLALRMLRVGDEAGDLPSVARHAASFYEHRLRTGLDRLMGIIGPAAIVAVSAIVGSIILSIMSALLSITELAT